tara:strand:- start:1643 stop:2038 length:396 start_codon:yes stop_codon:yes gene_type:complete
MDSQLRFIEDNFLYNIEDWFFEKLSFYTSDEATLIVSQMIAIIEELPSKRIWTQEIAGVIKGSNPLFFVVEYLKEDEETPTLVDLHEIDSDEYLDFILNKKTIKSYYNDRENGRDDYEPSGVRVSKRDNKN